MTKMHSNRLLCQHCGTWLLTLENGDKRCNSCGYTCDRWEINMITMRELLGNNKLEDLSQEIQDNLKLLHEKINEFRVIYDKAMIVTSGVRSISHHIEIYKSLAKQRQVPYDESKVPMGSKHLSGEAVDISDKKGELYRFCEDNLKVLEDIGLWIELQDDQKRVHFQIVKYGSWVPGKTRFFKA